MSKPVVMTTDVPACHSARGCVYDLSGICLFCGNPDEYDVDQALAQRPRVDDVAGWGDSGDPWQGGPA